MIGAADYQFISELLHRHSGLSLGAGKEYLIEGRLVPVATSLGLAGLPELLARLKAHPDAELVRVVCEAMATHESLFFRDATPFRLLQEQVIPELIAKRRASRRLRIWCAAASTGQEPYSVAMLLAEMRQALQGWSVEILGTDYSRPALTRARSGIYNHFEVQRGLPIQFLTRYFHKLGAEWQLEPDIRRAVTFREMNLLDPFTHLGRFDLVLCRNVLIYFDVQTKTDVLARLHQALTPDGYLFLGGSETAMGISERFERVPDAPTSLYRPSRSAAALSLAS